MSVLELQSKYFPIQPRAVHTNILQPAMPSSSSDGSISGDKPVIRLREPRDLYSTTSLQHAPKWPIECQVIPEKIRHIETAPAKLEPFYMSSNSEPQPKPVGEEMGTIVYDYQPKLSVDYFCRSCVGGSEDLQNFESGEPNALKFESRFESGNLAKAIKVTNVYYELHLRQDMYTDRHSQWFYFRIQNTKDNLFYRFSIVNFNKPDSLYRYGLKVLMYSEKEAQLHKTGWTRCGQNISYFKNDAPSDENGSLYTLTFNLKFRHSNDTIYLAHCYPYTYSTLQNYLKTIEEDRYKSGLVTVRLLSRSLAGNNVYIVTITSPDNYQEENTKKPAVVISARVHPGETQSSYMMKGIIDFLTSNSPQAQELRDRFIFKLIPMLNPDGVIVGNSRCCLLGQDLNRQYRTVLREAFPQIYHTKVLLRRLVEENGVFMYCDIHGHSRRNNVFIYGCENRKFPEKKLIEQVFPLMMHKNAADKFSFQNCKFRVQKTKEGTGRVFAWTLGVVNSFTLEISLGGSTMPSRQYTHFNTADYEAIGRHFCETLMDFSDPSLPKERLRDKILQKLMDGGSNADEPVNVPLTDYSSLSHSESEDSCEEGEKDKEIEPLPIKRQNSLRIPKKRPKPIPIPFDRRPALNLNKTSVDFIRIGQKQQKVVGESADDLLLTRELAVFKRLTKFRRKTRISDQLSGVVTERESNTIGYLPTPKYTSILFDDPFNPPGAATFQRRFNRTEETMEDASGSGSEDECDEHDAAMTNKSFVRERDIGSETDLAEEMSLLSISATNLNRLTSDTAPIPMPSHSAQPQPTLPQLSKPSISFAPFVPKLPQGKPLRSFYSMDFDEKSTKVGLEKDSKLVETPRRASLTISTPISSERRASHHHHTNRSIQSLKRPPLLDKAASSQQRRLSKVDVPNGGNKNSTSTSLLFSKSSQTFPAVSSSSRDIKTKSFRKSKSSISIEKAESKPTAKNGSISKSNDSSEISRSYSSKQSASYFEIPISNKKKRSKVKRSKSKKLP